MQTQFCVSFISFVVTKREFSNTEKLLVFKSVFVPILTHGRESWGWLKGCYHKYKRQK